MGSSPLTYGLEASVSTFLDPLANEKYRIAAFFGKLFLVISSLNRFWLHPVPLFLTQFAFH
jgi:hypothetical protein